MSTGGGQLSGMLEAARATREALEATSRRRAAARGVRERVTTMPPTRSMRNILGCSKGWAAPSTAALLWLRETAAASAAVSPGRHYW